MDPLPLVSEQVLELLLVVLPLELEQPLLASVPVLVLQLEVLPELLVVLEVESPLDSNFNPN